MFGFIHYDEPSLTVLGSLIIPPLKIKVEPITNLLKCQLYRIAGRNSGSVNSYGEEPYASLIGRQEREGFENHRLAMGPVSDCVPDAAAS